MATRGWQHATLADVIQRQAATPSKYRNVKTTIDGQTFDSKREADHWIQLQAREELGEITQLRRQVPFPLFCPYEDRAVLVSTYVADFVYVEQGRQHVVDAKGHGTDVYKLKRRWLQLQDGIRIEEV